MEEEAGGVVRGLVMETRSGKKRTKRWRWRRRWDTSLTLSSKLFFVSGLFLCFSVFSPVAVAVAFHNGPFPEYSLQQLFVVG